ncbi:MAG: RluA family pseudouridine synthase [Planctomycetaceae bacterium]|nr:RluA family pseudouridine synthase [Planctomycetaceae bacterium]
MPIVDAHHTVEPEQAGRIDRIVQELTGRSRADVKGLFHHHCVARNDIECLNPGEPVVAGDIVRVRHDSHRRYHVPPPERKQAEFGLIHEDDDIIVVDKTAGVLSVPTALNEGNTLLDLLTARIARQRRRGRAIAVHRLDRGTSGVLVFAKHQRAADGLQTQFREHNVNREYAAIVAGRLRSSTGTFQSRLRTGKDLRRFSVPDDEPGEDAVTHYRVEQELDRATLVRVTLETGRRNQIRVHFAEAGHPVLGDDKYEPAAARHKRWKAKRFALHAAVLGFAHPLSNRAMRFESPLPPEFVQFVAGSH